MSRLEYVLPSRVELEEARERTSIVGEMAENIARHSLDPEIATLAAMLAELAQHHVELSNVVERIRNYSTLLAAGTST